MKPTAYEWRNPETGHCYVDYIERPDLGLEKDGYVRTPLYTHLLPSPTKTAEEVLVETVDCFGQVLPIVSWDVAIKAMERYRAMRGQTVPIDQYPDTEADGLVFCGKCGKMK